MDFASIIKELSGVVSSFAQSQPLMTFILSLVFIFLIYRRPLFFFSVLTLGLLVAGTFYFIVSMSGPGVSNKEKMIKRSLPENHFRSPGIQQ
jgi:hypothetical protein